MTMQQVSNLVATGYVYNTVFDRILHIDRIRNYTDSYGQSAYIMICRDNTRCYDVIDADVLVVSLPPDKARDAGFSFEAS